MMAVMILVAFGLVLDRGFNHGRLTIQLAIVADDAGLWVARSSSKVAHSLYGFGS
jgi:hypothetical protein